MAASIVPFLLSAPMPPVQKALLCRHCSSSFKSTVLPRSSPSGHLFHCLDFSDLTLLIYARAFFLSLSTGVSLWDPVFLISGWNPQSVTRHPAHNRCLINVRYKQGWEGS